MFIDSGGACALRHLFSFPYDPYPKLEEGAQCCIQDSREERARV